MVRIDRGVVGDYVTFNETCKRISNRPATFTGVRMEGDSTATVQLDVGGMTDTRTVVYEDGQSLMTPPDELVQQFVKPVDEIIRCRKVVGFRRRSKR